MRVIDKGYDPVLDAKFELCSTTYGELKIVSRSWYEGINFNDFDERRPHESDEKSIKEMKLSGLTSNYFVALRDSDDNYYLLDGFNRLFTDYSQVEFDEMPVYVKVITEELEDWRIMHIMFRLNMWKIQERVFGNFRVIDFFDRGFRLFLYKKFGIKFYSYRIHSSNWNERTRDRDDFEPLDMYFRKKWIASSDYSYRLHSLSILMKNKKIIEDIKSILDINNYKDEPFINFRIFFEVYIVFLAEKRIEDEINGVISDYSFEKYFNGIKEDSKFFKKFTGMSGNDSTRKNAYYWFEEFDKKINHEKNS